MLAKAFLHVAVPLAANEHLAWMLVLGIPTCINLDYYNIIFDSISIIIPIGFTKLLMYILVCTCAM